MTRGAWVALGIIAATAGCGGSSYGGGGTVSSTSTPTGFVITISNMSFSPLDLAVPAGATVTVVNDDGMPHSVTSEASPGSYTPGAPSGLTPFDTGQFSSGQRTFTVPANATAGTVIPFYCSNHKQAMATPNGSITIDPNAKPNSATTTTTPGVGGY